MAGSARFTRKYTDAQLEAFLKAVLIDRHTTADAIRMAPTGQLGVPAFTINRGYAYEMVKRRREGYELEHPEALAVAIDRELMALAGKALSQARALSKAENADPDQLRRAIQALKTAQGAIKPAPKPDAPVQTNAPEPTRPAENTLTALLGKAPTKTSAKSEQSAPNPVVSRAA